ncbi:MAG: helix-turn-helix domain-containing protein [Planctomycetota bacterium]|nr:helix-turn-helix domain-containing protein [Planctomycetota bacterium]
MSVEQLCSPSRVRKVSGPRGILILLLRKKLNMPFKKIARILNRKHPSIIEMANKTEQRVSDLEDWRRDWNNILDI